MTVVIECYTSRDTWLALEATFSDKSKAQELRLKDELQLIRKGSRTVLDYGKHFKSLCGQLVAIGRSVDDSDKSHWFLHGFGTVFSSFSATQMAQVPLPNFSELLSRAENFDLFQKAMEVAEQTPAAAFLAYSPNSGSHQTPRGRGRSGNRGRGGYHSGGSGKGRPKYPPKCQIYREECNYADKCPQRYSTHSTNLEEAFNAPGSLAPTVQSDWYMDTDAFAHMTPHATNLENITPYFGPNQVVVGNGDTLCVSHIGSCSLKNSVKLLDVLVVPRLTKNLLSISKLTNDYPIDVLFTDNSFTL
ncbi:hypothetical protein TanjilG_08808 [Lupinus angustifolius]|uniref:Retrovirus-related Pol polyprotein from transposon TNT 1-94-like beta-barrel domain-containing protein n=1 Tax=Lupinus angustifolius TaxID=3871 RepID=A0A4P1RPP7_LUPAN|nr:hypothetical protein TanjilG_08808 [Lupinus angustifolius]